jgi:hypothetical protein
MDAKTDEANRQVRSNLDEMNAKLKILYKLRVVKIGWLNEQMYHKLLKKERIVNIMVHVIQGIVFLLNGIASAIGSEVDYRWWTITTALIAVFAGYINKMKDDTAYGSKIELHRSMTDECMKFTDILDISNTIADKTYESLLERSSKLHIDPDIYDAWDVEFKARGIKESNAFDIASDLTTQLDQINVIVSPREINPLITTTAAQAKNKKADFELQRLFQNLNVKLED